MATFHINRSGTNLGTFPEEDVRAGLQSGRFLGTDLGWREGMATWQPLAQIPELTQGAVAGAAGPPPQPAAGGTAPSFGTTAAARSGLPWDDRQQKGFFSAFIETLQMVLTKPVEAFTAMRREGGFGEPLIYAVIGGSVGVIFSSVVALGLNSLGVLGSRQDALGSMMGMTTVISMGLVLRLVGVALAPFIFGGLVHLSLMLVGGAKPFETTFRVIAFSQGSTMPLQIVPWCGGFVALGWFLVANCIGLARAHETDTGRAVLAVFLPLIVCCGGIFTLIMIGAFRFPHH